MKVYPTKPIGKLCRLINGRAFKPSEWEQKGLPIVRIQNLNDHSKPFNRFDGEYSDKHSIENGAILLSWSGTPGTSFGCFRWQRGPALLNQHIFKVVTEDNIIDGEYFIYAVNSRLDEMIYQAHGGVGLRHITKSKLEAIQLPVPKLDEQLRIVARIKECMERVEEVEELQDSINEESSNLPTASKFDLWSECVEQFNQITVRDVVLSAKNGLYKPKKFHGSGIALLRMFNIKDGELTLDRIERLQTTKKETKDFAVMNGNIIVSRVNSKELVGKSAFVEGLNEPAVNEAMIIRLKINDKRVNGRFLAWLMNSPQFLYDLRGRAKHAIGQSSINQSDLLNSKIPLPRIEQQKTIVESKRQLLPFSFNLQQEIAEQREIISGLRISILRKAFAGEL